jgi:hypothetical protein
MPPFVPMFAEIGESQIVDKMMAVVDRDMKPALDALYAADNLPGFAAMTRGEADIFRYPLLVLGVERMTSEETESGEWLEQDITVGAGLVVKSTTVPLVKKLAEKYVRAFKAVVRKGVLELLPAGSAVVGYNIGIDHRYFRHGKANDGEFTQAVEFSIRIKYGEK